MRWDDKDIIVSVRKTGAFLETVSGVRILAVRRWRRRRAVHWQSLWGFGLQRWALGQVFGLPRLRSGYRTLLTLVIDEIDPFAAV